MAKSDKKRATGCPVAFALDTFGDRWSLLIIRDIVLRGSRSFGEFSAAREGIATNILAGRLRELEDEGILTRSRDPDNHRKILYTLTDKGFNLVPVMFEMIRWSARYDPDTKARPEVLARIEADRDAYIDELKASHKKAVSATE